MQPYQPHAGAKEEIAAAYDLVAQGKLVDAEAACRRALAIDGRNPKAWTVFGVVLRELQQPAESEAAYRRALALAPSHVAAQHNLGALLSHLERADEALVALDRAAALGLRAAELYVNRGRTLAQLYRLEEAERSYMQAVTVEPRNASAQASLANLRYMRGDPAFARDIDSVAKGHPGDVPLQLAHADILQRSGSLVRAEAVLRDALRTSGAIPELRSALAVVLHETGRLKEAETEALEASIGRPHNTTIIANLVALELARGEPEIALQFIRVQRQRQPLEQRWIAYAAIAARMLQDPLYEKLYDYERLVRVYELAAPRGWSSIAELNAALVEALGVRHRFAGHPLDQSLRNGSQTARSLLTESDAAIKGLLAAFSEPLADYRAALGTAGDHPLSARNRGTLSLSGCWSVALKRDGFHVNHIHPEGWLSSAYYVSVPAEVDNVVSKSGWIKFGEPRMPVPGILAEHAVQPRPGRLVLFPSYMWHGTNEIHGDEPRLSVAFDAVPQSRYAS